jgi:hypothetical protein
LSIVLLLEIGDGEIARCGRIAGTKLERTAIERDGLRQFAFVGERNGKIVQNLNGIRIN